MATVIYKNANILDGTKNMVLQKNKAIIVENGKIFDIIDSDEVVDESITVDLNGQFVMPGLINLHCHLPGSGKPMNMSITAGDTAKKIEKALEYGLVNNIAKKLCYGFAKAELLSGVTTLRTVGGLSTIDAQLRDDINSGKMQGPNILASNKAISVPGGHMAGLLAFPATSVEEAEKYVDVIAEGKPDLIKVMITGGVLDADESGAPGAMKMPPEYVEAVCRRAHKLGFQVAAHVESPEGVKVALECGVDTIEHGAELSDELINLFKEKNAKLICTISPAIPMKLLPAEKMPDENYKINGTIVCDGIISAAKTALENGIQVGLGNDVGCPYVRHYNFWRELVYFNHFVGASTMDTLHIATLGNAQIAGIDKETGSIEIGKNADMIVLKEDPTKDLNVLRNPVAVIKDGKSVKGKLKKDQSIEDLLDGMKL